MDVVDRIWIFLNPPDARAEGTLAVAAKLFIDAAGQWEEFQTGGKSHKNASHFPGVQWSIQAGSFRHFVPE